MNLVEERDGEYLIVRIDVNRIDSTNCKQLDEYIISLKERGRIRSYLIFLS